MVFPEEPCPTIAKFRILEASNSGIMLSIFIEDQKIVLPFLNHVNRKIINYEESLK
jgi:hypothetical protein